MLFVPQGLTGLILMHAPAYRTGRLGLIAGPYLLAAIPLASMLIGVIGLLEMTSFVERAGVGDTEIHLFYSTIDTRELAALARLRGSGHHGRVGLPDGSSGRPLGLGAGERPARAARRDRRGAGCPPIRSPPRTGRRMTPALQLTDLHKSFGQTEIIRGVNLEIRRGERHAIIGPNGAGKSTLFHLISGRYRPTSGSIRLRGEDVGGLAPYEIYRKGWRAVSR